MDGWKLFHEVDGNGVPRLYGIGSCFKSPRVCASDFAHLQVVQDLPKCLHKFGGWATIFLSTKSHVWFCPKLSREACDHACM